MDDKSVVDEQKHAPVHHVEHEPRMNAAHCQLPRPFFVVNLLRAVEQARVLKLKHGFTGLGVLDWLWLLGGDL